MKAKDNIEELIGQNLDQLNDWEPGEGHFERFEAKLKKQHKTKTIKFSTVLKVAAAVVFVFLAVNQAFIYFAPEKNPEIAENRDASGISLASVSPEYSEVEFYYNTAIETGLEQWNLLAADGLVTAAEKEMLEKEIAGFEEQFKALQTDLAANPEDERVINAMLGYYEAKLGIINMIVSKLKEVKQQKKNNNEKNV